MPVTVTGNHPRPFEPWTAIVSPFSVYCAAWSSLSLSSGQGAERGGGGGSESRYAVSFDFDNAMGGGFGEPPDIRDPEPIVRFPDDQARSFEKGQIERSILRGPL